MQVKRGFDCSLCRGTGVIELSYDPYDIEGPLRDSVECSECHGTGNEKWQKNEHGDPCNECYGTGLEKYRSEEDDER